jgi:hypothetical protein
MPKLGFAALNPAYCHYLIVIPAFAGMTAKKNGPGDCAPGPLFPGLLKCG